MKESTFLRLAALSLMLLLLVLSPLDTTRQAAAPTDPCEDCIHVCKVDFELCLADGKPEAECRAKLANCEAACPCP
jgi:hypothetical protein